MYKALIFLILVICNGCSTAISKEVIRLDSQVVTTSSPEIVENKLKETPFDIWERIRSELTIRIPEDQIAATSIYRERLYKNCLLYTSPSPRDHQPSRMPSSA